jgi:D-sedoheptulose 7-phosphate isomerase
MSCVANDYGYDFVFSRYIESQGKMGDCLLAISTSGKSRSIIHAAQAAQEKGIKVISLTGQAQSSLQDCSDINIITPAGQYADRVQELHIKVIHILIELIEFQMQNLSVSMDKV